MIPGRLENLEVEVVDSPNGAKILKLTGPLTLTTLSNFQNASRQNQGAPVILDIGAVPYMDSAGLGSVISLFAACQRSDRGFAITGVPDRIRTLFEVTHCDGLLPCYESLESADQAIAR